MIFQRCQWVLNARLVKTLLGTSMMNFYTYEYVIRSFFIPIRYIGCGHILPYPIPATQWELIIRYVGLEYRSDPYKILKLYDGHKDNMLFQHLSLSMRFGTFIFYIWFLTIAIKMSMSTEMLAGMDTRLVLVAHTSGGYGFCNHDGQRV